MELELIEKEIDEGRALPIIRGREGKCHIVELDGKRYFHKRYPVFPQEKPEVATERARFNSFKFGMPSTCYINNDVSAEQRADKEFSTIQKWDRLGIPTPSPIAWRSTRVVYEFMPGHSLADMINSINLNERDFGYMLDCFHGIRNVAKDFRDIELLHSDPFADNFFYDSGHGIVVPVDPSKVIVKEEFETTDGRLNLFFLCKLFHLDTTQKNQIDYLKQAVDRLTNDERQIISDLNTDPFEARTFFESYGKKWSADRLSVYYSKEILGTIQEALSK